MSDAYCMWNEYTGEFDIVPCSYENMAAMDPVVALLYEGRVKESDLLPDNMYEEYPEGPYMEPPIPSVYTSCPYEYSTLMFLNTQTLPPLSRCMDNWIVIKDSPKKQAVEEVQIIEKKDHSWTQEEGRIINMREDPDTISMVCKETGTTTSHTNMDQVLYDIYIPKGEYRSIYTIMTKHKELSHTAHKYIRWFIETQKCASMEELSAVLRVAQPEGWKTMKKSEVIGTIKKMVGESIRREFNWENAWCPIGSGFVNFGHIIENIQKKSTQPTRLLSKPMPFSTQQEQPKNTPYRQNNRQDQTHLNKDNKNERNNNRNNRNQQDSQRPNKPQNTQSQTPARPQQNQSRQTNNKKQKPKN